MRKIAVNTAPKKGITSGSSRKTYAAHFCVWLAPFYAKILRYGFRCAGRYADKK